VQPAHDILGGISRGRIPASLALLVAMVIVGSTCGCRICCDGEDLAYSAYGGIWQRTIRESGRVGSVFDPGGARVADLSPRDDGRQPRIFEPDDYEELKELESGDAASPDDAPDGLDQQDDEAFQKRLEEFRRQQQQDTPDNQQEIDVIPGQTLPPDLS